MDKEVFMAKIHGRSTQAKVCRVQHGREALVEERM
jgi:hypothetical protein